MIDVTQSKIHQFDHFRKRRPRHNRIRIQSLTQSLFQKVILWLKCHFNGMDNLKLSLTTFSRLRSASFEPWAMSHGLWFIPYGQPGFITGFILKIAFGIFWVMAVSFSLSSASVYVMLALFRLWCDYIGSSKMIFVALHIAICDRNS